MIEKIGESFSLSKRDDSQLIQIVVHIGEVSKRSIEMRGPRCSQLRCRFVIKEAGRKQLSAYSHHGDMPDNAVVGH
jgi:hypothetical protein